MILRKHLGLAFREGGRLERVSSGDGSNEGLGMGAKGFKIYSC